VVPGILEDFDCPRMLTANTPRPLLILNGENDRTAAEGAKLALPAKNFNRASGIKLQMDVAPG